MTAHNSDTAFADEPIIQRPIGLTRRPAAPRRFLLAAGLVALLVHGYALAFLPTIANVAWDWVVEANLVNDDIGNDPDLPMMKYQLRPPIVPDAADDQPVTIPPPPGFENLGQGGGIDLPLSESPRGEDLPQPCF
jgi:hypothetical protein